MVDHPQFAGILYVISTPIGNLEDLSPRAARILGEVHVVAAEDTRSAAFLLRHAGVADASVVSFHEHNEIERTRQLVTDLLEGRDVGLISEAGTPGISDPGFRLVRGARLRGIAVRSVPGPSAFLAALSVSGLPTDQFAFLGFPPRGNALRKWLEEHLAAGMTLVFYEGPSRVLDTLEAIDEAAPERLASISREITKIYEDTRSGLARELAEHYRSHRDQLRGEFVIALAPPGYGLGAGDRAEETAVGHRVDDAGDPIKMRQIDLLIEAGLRPSEAVAIVARGHQVPKSPLYRDYQGWREDRERK